MHASLKHPTQALRRVTWLRPLLGHRILNGLAVGVGLAILSVAVYLIGGAAVAASASVGMLVLSIGDQTAPARGKLRQIAPLLWLAAPLTLAVQFAHLAPPQLMNALIGALVCAGGFVGMLGTAWGARGAPLGFALLLAIVFAMSTPAPPDARSALIHVAWFELGTLLYAAYAVLSAHVLNTRFRRLALAEAIAELATMLRQQAARLAATGDRRDTRLRALLGEQAVLADKLQVARDLVLDTPRSTRQMRLAAMLIGTIRLREQALANELESDMQALRHAATPTLAQAQALETLWQAFAERLDQVCWSLVSGTPLPAEAAVAAHGDELPATARAACAAMARELHDIVRWTDADGDAPPPDLAAQARDWPRFRSSMRWPIAPLQRALSGHSPVLRYAVRVTIALGAGYAIGLHLPWAAHPHWILLTIAVAMRTNLAQTLERRNARLIGTAIGCVLVAALLSLHPNVPLQFALLALGAAVAHGFAQVRYLVAATAATVLALIQGHLLHTSGEFALAERLADTLIGTAIAWGFSYVLPAWERRQLPALLTRIRTAQLQHARIALGSVELESANADWRLARREVHDSLAAAALAAQRAGAEPRGVRPPLDLLERIQLRSYRLLAQLGGVRTWREQPQSVPAADVDALLARCLTSIDGALEPRRGPDAASTDTAPIEALTETVSAHESAAVLRRRLVDAVDEARALGADLAAAQAWDAARIADNP